MQLERDRLIQQAKEEVEMLEHQHPNKFKWLKQDLKDFISNLESESQNQTPISSYTDTQESSSNKRRKVDAQVVRGTMKRKSKTDAVLERAQQCLLEIQDLKASLSLQLGMFKR